MHGFKLRIGDLLALIAALGIGFALSARYWSDMATLPPVDMMYAGWLGWPKHVLLGVPVLMTLSVASISLRFLRSETPRTRYIRLAGSIAMLSVVSIYIISTTMSLLLLGLGRAGQRPDVLLQFWILGTSEVPQQVALAIAVAWSVLAICGQWSRSLDAIDYICRSLGLCGSFWGSWFGRSHSMISSTSPLYLISPHCEVTMSSFFGSQSEFEIRPRV
jgi:hypothetical protein